ncbi:MAG: ATP-binding cassette domain-containing protein [Acutalibacteraceae bacterium]
MLETKNLVKIYKPKKGVPVTAINNLSIKFPETGMVFLTGKSGSGKSTLLNLLGGLDSYNDGEIIIKGVSSKDFKQKHFDSYRNTYVGFIFQEYNVLDDFSVGANIAIAIELQNRKATDEEINEILEKVDLQGYGNRKPNELSGGQKQRVAIARALVKKPEIIMADEPTGALDSNTGKQIFDTLKKLSKEKLVIVVSHDREFAETYADRIIELADGEVINDIERSTEDYKPENDGMRFSGNTIELPEGYTLTEEDRKAINEYIQKLKNKSVKLEVSENTKHLGKFVPTDTSKIKVQDGSSFKLIKSKLPLKNAFKIGAGALKYKKIRLVVTILLSCLSFSFFGLADTFGAYTFISGSTNSLYDSGDKYVTISKSKFLGEGKNARWVETGFMFSDEELKETEKKTGVKLHGIFMPFEANLSFKGNINPSIRLTTTKYNIFNTSFSGCAEINEKILKELGLKILEGRLPDGSKDEIAISEYIFELFKTAYYTDGTYELNMEGKKNIFYWAVQEPKHMIGKVLTVGGKDYTVTAVIDTNFDIERYRPLTRPYVYTTEADEILRDTLYTEFTSIVNYSYSGVMMVGEGFVERLRETQPKIFKSNQGEVRFSGGDYVAGPKFYARLEDVADQKIHWVFGPMKKLGKKDIIITTDIMEYWGLDAPTTMKGWLENLKNAELLTAWKDLLTDDSDVATAEEGYRIVGLIESKRNSRIHETAVCSDYLYYQLVEKGNNHYSFAVGELPEEKGDIRRFVKYCYIEGGNTRYKIQNSSTWQVETIDEKLDQFALIFLYIGFGFAAFASLMLANFIATSITYKKQEIGILRAIGSRGNDVFRIFFAESFIIAVINFILSSIGVGVATHFLNNVIREKMKILITVLDFGVRQVALLLVISIFIAFVASYLPVKKVASKRPIDAIRNR